MGLVLIITGGAVVILKVYNSAKSAALLEVAVPVLRQQAAVVATLAGMVFLLLDALEKGKVAVTMLSNAAAAAPSAGSAFGGPVGQRIAAAALASGNVPG